MDIANIGQIPPFTRFYLVMILITTVLINFIPYLPTYWLFAFSIKQIVHSYQYWRLVTNFLIAGKFSLGFLFFVASLYMRLSRLESDCIRRRKYAEFIMTLIYNSVFMIGISFFNYYVLGYTENRSLLESFTYALMSIYSYRAPNEPIIIFFIPVRNSIAPAALAFFAICSGGSLMSILIGFCSGYLFVFLNEILPLKGIHLIWIPSFLSRLCKDSILKKKKDDEPQESRRREPYVHVNPNDSTNTAYRERGTVSEGNEFRPHDPNDIPW